MPEHRPGRRVAHQRGGGVEPLARVEAGPAVPDLVARLDPDRVGRADVGDDMPGDQGHQCVRILRRDVHPERRTGELRREGCRVLVWLLAIAGLRLDGRMPAGRERRGCQVDLRRRVDRLEWRRVGPPDEERRGDRVGARNEDGVGIGRLESGDDERPRARQQGGLRERDLTRAVHGQDRGPGRGRVECERLVPGRGRVGREREVRPIGDRGDGGIRRDSGARHGHVGHQCRCAGDRHVRRAGRQRTRQRREHDHRLGRLVEICVGDPGHNGRAGRRRAGHRPARLVRGVGLDDIGERHRHRAGKAHILPGHQAVRGRRAQLEDDPGVAAEVVVDAESAVGRRERDVGRFRDEAHPGPGGRGDRQPVRAAKGEQDLLRCSARTTPSAVAATESVTWLALSTDATVVPLGTISVPEVSIAVNVMPAAMSAVLDIPLTMVDPDVSVPVRWTPNRAM